MNVFLGEKRSWKNIQSKHVILHYSWNKNPAHESLLSEK